MGEREASEYRTIDNCAIEMPGPCGLVIFGATGDLTKRKIIPSLFRLYRQGLLSENFFILGCSRTALKDEQFRGMTAEAAREVIPDDYRTDSWEAFARQMYGLSLDYTVAESYGLLEDKISSLEANHRSGGNRIFYLAVPPDIYEAIIANLGSAGLSREKPGYSHVVIEKPIGHDLESAKSLNAVLGRAFREDQIYRMDHYLAKETVQNIIMFRFANSIFEPVWNRRYIDHVQITVSETLGIERRAGYYERAGVVRDMFQNHIFQLLALVAMEPPVAFNAESVRDERVRVFRSVRPFGLGAPEDAIVLGQYGPGSVDGLPVPGYRKEKGISEGSLTPTFAAMKVFIDNWRWHDVPFYLRSGKRLARRKAEISIHFRRVPHLMFSNLIEEAIEPNALVIKVQPEEGISIFFQAKTPGSRVCLSEETMDFSYEAVFSISDYERILLDCMQGDQMLFVREDCVEQTWALFTPLLEAVESSSGLRQFPNYPAGSVGPPGASAMIERDGRQWRPL